MKHFNRTLTFRSMIDFLGSLLSRSPGGRLVRERTRTQTSALRIGKQASYHRAIPAFFYIPIKFYKNKQGLQDDATRNMEIHSNPVTITFNIDLQIDITFKDYK